jgi:hypothetical protein
VNYENRSLENCQIDHLPKFSTYKYGFNKVKRCVEDHLIIKPYIIRLAHTIKKQYGKSQDPNLIIGKSGWSFLANANDITNQYRGINRYTDIELNMVSENISYFTKILKSYNIDLYIIIIPTQQVIYSEYLPNFITVINNDRRIYQLLRTVQDNSNILYLQDCLLNKKKNGLLFNKVEGHWTELGGLYGFECISEFLSFRDKSIRKINIDKYQIKNVEVDFPPISYSQILPTVSNKDNKWDTRFITENSDNTTYIQSLNNNKFSNKTLINGDSFMEMSHQFIADVFQDAHIISHQRQGLGLSTILKYRPKRVVFIASERFLQNIFYDISEIYPSENFSKNRMSNIGKHNFDTLNITNNSIHLSGWAHNYKGVEAYKMIVLVNNLPIFQSNPNRYRPDLKLQDNRLGFDFNIQISQNIKTIDLLIQYFDGSTELISAYK